MSSGTVTLGPLWIPNITPAIMPVVVAVSFVVSPVPPATDAAADSTTDAAVEEPVTEIVTAPLLPSLEAVMLAVPRPVAVTTPVGDTAAIAPLDDE